MHLTDDIVPEDVRVDDFLENPVKTSTDYEEEIKQLKSDLLRALADNENARKRFLKEKEDLMRYSVSNFARDMLSLSDNLGRALIRPPTDFPETVSQTLEGLDLVLKEVHQTLERHGIKKIEALGKMFDPNHHQAMFEIETHESSKPGTILQVLQEGYVIHERLLRPAMVGVAKDVQPVEQTQVSEKN